MPKHFHKFLRDTININKNILTSLLNIEACAILLCNNLMKKLFFLKGSQANFFFFFSPEKSLLTQTNMFKITRFNDLAVFKNRLLTWF